MNLAETKTAVVQEVEITFDGRTYSQAIQTPYGADKEQLSKWEQMLREEVEQEIVEKWLDNQSEAKRMSHDKRMAKEGADIDKMRSMQLKWSWKKVTFNKVIKYQPQIIDHSFGHVYWKSSMLKKDEETAKNCLDKKLYTNAMETAKAENKHPNTLVWHIQEVEQWESTESLPNRSIHK